MSAFKDVFQQTKNFDISQVKNPFQRMQEDRVQGDSENHIQNIDRSVGRLSWQNRLILFGVTIALGTILSFLSAGLWNTAVFIVLYVLGTILMFGSTLFLVGIVTQIKNLKDMKRLIPILVYVLCIVVNLVVGIVPRIVAVVIILVFIQLAAMVWYGITYIPGAMSYISSVLHR